MVARSPPKHKKLLMAVPLSPTLIRETVKKVDQCMARLQEIQYTVAGGGRGAKAGSSGISLSPNRSRGHLRSNVKYKQDSMRMRGSAVGKKSPVGKLPQDATVEWRQMSLPAMLVQETMCEILQASKSAKEALESMSKPSKKSNTDEPKTPMTRLRRQRMNPENTGLEARRRREKQHVFRIIQSESNTPSLNRARSRRINFKVSSPPRVAVLGKENGYYLSNKVSPRNRPWAKKTVLFPNPLFHSSPTSHHHKFCRTMSPVITRKNNVRTPHKFLIKSQSSASPKFQVKIKSPLVKVSPPRSISICRGRSPMKVLSNASKLRRSLSPSRLVSRLVSPLKSRVNLQKNNQEMASGLKQRPTMMMMPMTRRA